MQKVLRQTDQLKNIEMSQTQLRVVIMAQISEINRLKAINAELLEALKGSEKLTLIEAGALS
jgi:hypothetical protein